MEDTLLLQDRRGDALLKVIGVVLAALFLLTRGFSIIKFLLVLGVRLIRPAIYVYGALRTFGVVGNASKRKPL